MLLAAQEDWPLVHTFMSQFSLLADARCCVCVPWRAVSVVSHWLVTLLTALFQIKCENVSQGVTFLLCVLNITIF